MKYRRNIDDSTECDWHDGFFAEVIRTGGSVATYFIFSSARKLFNVHCFVGGLLDFFFVSVEIVLFLKSVGIQ